MRTIGRLVVAGFAVLALPHAAAAQEGRLFQNSWFWGAKGGSFYFNSPTVDGGFAATVGGEWLITRTRTALYIAAQEVFMWEGPGVSRIDDPYAFSGRKDVYVSDIRSATIAMMAFPRVIGENFRPYAGLGFTFMNAFSSGPVLTGTESAAERAFLDEAVDESKEFFGFVGMAGLQMQYRRFSVFGQATMMPQQSTSSWFFNTNHNYLLEAGIRWNMGSSIDSRP